MRSDKIWGGSARYRVSENLIVTGPFFLQTHVLYLAIIGHGREAEWVKTVTSQIMSINE